MDDLNHARLDALAGGHLAAVRFVLRVTAYAALVVYIGWNLFHLCLLRVPPSLLVALTGIPCPTTGGTRAVLALLNGDWSESLGWNPLAVPITLLGFLSVLELVRGRVVEQRFRLPDRWLSVWLVTLTISWLLQLWLAWNGTPLAVAR